MKCFIASAFGHDDVDIIYDRCVIPTLKQLSVTPLRVDRVEHNEDIDNKIFELLDLADFAIADLTYARPSVYYEAGYAVGRSKPVIYIAKSDHFRARDNDQYGNFRVHFDLQMRNIIPWTTPDHTFTGKLLDRVQYVLRPLERANRQKLELLTERSDFNSQAIYSRLEILKKTSVDLLRARSFQSFHPNLEGTNGNAPTLVAYLRKINAPRFQAVGIITTTSAMKQLLQYLSWHSLNYEAPNDPNLLWRETHYVVASLNAVPRSRIREALPSFHQRNNITLTSESMKPRGTKSSLTHVHIIDGIKSKSEFEAAFRAVIEDNGLGNGA
jgi:nucleoside 2-deoxyribosyltransferase